MNSLPTLLSVSTATLAAALLGAGACAHAAAAPVPSASPAAIDAWPTIAEADLAQMRGGLDLGTLVANFAIERVVRINGELVARTQLVMTDLGRLSAGMLPNVQLVGNLANLVQVGQGNALAADVTAAASTAAAQALEAAGLPGGTSGPAPAAQGSSGSVSATNIASGLQASFADGLAHGVAVATGEDASLRPPAPVPVPASSASTGSPPSAAAAASTATSVPAATAPTSAQASASVPTSAPASAALVVPATTTITVPLGNTGQVIVVSNLPNAAALATSIQNSVQATRIQAETSISVTLNSLSALRSAAFAEGLRQQAIASTRR
ncbi:MAG: hypothetical protein J0H00_18300 [Burkholderiales bacterium]|nr:hypothetical protein [Burkholderiales bacterium]OJX02295.1 MAG: hypothetical protein BGO72_00920 [Burkholderiales bacterium 70-64]